jgi:hypothetical protein
LRGKIADLRLDLDYQFGNGSTAQMLSRWQQGESLEALVIQVKNQKTEITRKLQQLTNIHSRFF